MNSPISGHPEPTDALLAEFVQGANVQLVAIEEVPERDVEWRCRLPGILNARDELIPKINTTFAGVNVVFDTPLGSAR